MKRGIDDPKSCLYLFNFYQVNVIESDTKEKSLSSQI